MEISKGKTYNINPAPPNKEQTYPSVTPEYPTLIVMIAVLGIILLFCFWGAPGVRDYCKRSICCNCRRNPRRRNSGSPGDDGSATPTIILLPFGRMLVVDRNVFSQLQADQTGIDFMELSANLIRAHQLQCGSTPSILDSDATSKGLSPISLGFSPPSYEDIFGEKNSDLPPSYSELSLLFRQRHSELSGINDINENELKRFHIGSDRNNRIADENNETKAGDGDSALELNEVEDTSNKAIANNENSFRVNVQLETETRVPSGNSIEFASNHPTGNDQESPENPLDACKIEEKFKKHKLDNCRYCIMSYENEKRGNNKCFCNKYEKQLTRRPTVLNYLDKGNAANNLRVFYTKTIEKCKSDEVISTDNDIGTRDEACCSTVSNRSTNDINIVDVSEVVNQADQPSCQDSIITKDDECEKSDSKTNKTQKCEVIKESSL